MWILAKYLKCVNIVRAVFLLLILCFYFCWHFQRLYNLNMFERRQFSNSISLLNSNFPKPSYDFLYPERNPDVVLSFLHIQKDGGTYIEESLILPGVFGFPCGCQKVSHACRCFKDGKIWLSSRQAQIA